MALELSSPAFPTGGRIPNAHTAMGEDRSPPLRWRGAPRGTRGFALLAEDPDAPAGTFVHWLAWNIPSEVSELPEGLPRTPAGMCQGINGYGRLGWGGPFPPAGKGSHRYVFRLFALDRLLDLKDGADRARLEEALANHVLAEAELMGRFHRTL